MIDRPPEIEIRPSQVDRGWTTSEWMRKNYQIYMDYFAHNPDPVDEERLSIKHSDEHLDFDVVSWGSIQQNLGSPSWPIDKVTQHTFLETIKEIQSWFSRLKNRYLEAKLPIAGVFRPEKLKPLTRDQKMALKKPIPPRVAVQTLEDLAAKVFIQDENLRQRFSRQAWQRLGKPIDNFINTFVLNSLWRGRQKVYRGLYGVEKTIGNFWETLTRMQPLGSGEGCSSLHAKGEALEKITSYEDLAYAMTTMGSVSLGYWDRVNERYQDLKSEQQKIHGDASLAVEESALEKAHLEGIYPEAFVNNGLEIESIKPETLLANAPGWIKGMVNRRLVLTRESHTPIDKSKAKVMYIDPQGNVLSVPASALEEDRSKVSVLVANWLKEGSQKPRDIAGERKVGWDVWECLEMASAGYGKSADVRYQAVKLVDTNGSQLKWSEVLRDVVCTLVASDKEGVHKSWSLSVPDVFQFKTEVNNGRVGVDELVSFKGHGFMDGMPHTRELGAILGEFTKRMSISRAGSELPVGTTALDKFSQRFSVQQGRLAVDKKSTEAVERAIHDDADWEGPRMLARAHLDITNKEDPEDVGVVELVRATKKFAKTVGEKEYEENRRFQLARDWVSSSIEKGELAKWAKICGQTPEWVKERVVKLIARNSEGVPDLTEITPAFVMSLAKNLTMSRDDLPVDHLAVEVHQMEGFVNGRMGAVIMVLDEEWAAVFNLAYLEDKNQLAQWYFQKILADRAIIIRGGTARAQINNGMIASFGSFMDPQLQSVLKKLTAILSGTFSRPPPARILTGSGTTSILTPLKSGQSIFDSGQSLNDGLYGKELHAYQFRTVTEGQPGYGMCIGGLQDQGALPTVLTETDPASGEKKEKAYYGYSLEFSLNEPLLMKWLLDPSRRKWLNEVMAVALSKGGKPKLHLLTPPGGNDDENERLLRVLYRTNRDVRERLQPVFDGFADDVREKFKINLGRLIKMLSEEPKGPLVHYVEPLQPPELSEMKKISKQKIKEDKFYWYGVYSKELVDAMSRALMP